MYTMHLQKGTVTRQSDGVIVAPAQSAEDPSFLAYIDWVNQGHTPEVIDEPAQNQPPPIIPANVFRDRFTDNEMDGILAAAYGGDSIARRLLLKLQTANEGIELTSDTVTGGMAYLQQTGLITAQRVLEILS